MTAFRDDTEALKFLELNPDISTIDVLLPDNCGVLRGKRLPAASLPKLFTEGCSFPGSIYAMDITGATVDTTGLSWDEGDPDRPCFPVPGTLQRTPWLRKPTGQILLSMHDQDGTPFFAAPRALVEQLKGRLAELGLTAVVAVELEFYLLDGDWGEEDKPRPPLSPTSGVRQSTTQVYGMNELYDFGHVLDEIEEAAHAQGIPTDTAVAEYGPGQCEINLHHVPDPVLAADHAILFKRVVRGVAAKHKLDATFMAKPYPQHAGSGMHVHVSLIDRDGRNVFETDRPEAIGSDLLLHAIGGLAATMPGAMALFAPNANSFRRFQVESYAPTAPTWGVNNRTTALRIPVGPPGSKRIEHRVAGADANPYLAVAAILAGILHGITNRIDPGEPVTGNGYNGAEASLPGNWVSALEAFENCRELRDLFGERFMHVHLETKWAERDKFFAYVTPLEYEWYLRTA
ncbi:glutamine synthetase family protein [Arenibaculum sp.]|jgi:glutamine synthetase|uniref:glutamine synthetase family protein n=1 Tax=Arenibaculum sp. TaxID=2865862 RepID=UPI002E104A6E|nr:glutamine synthetase family protein [Arenibaculum sp.]